LLIVLNLLYPGFILLDHGHFQYNCISLGLTFWALALFINNRHALGATAFTLALNYKQMSLYFALPFFFYLLGVTIHQPSYGRKLAKFLSIALAVVATFIVVWLPFIWSQNDLVQVLKRIFPVNRGLYEDKVANLWCSLEIIVKLKQLFTTGFLINLSAVTTLVSVLPSCLHLLARPTLRNLKYNLIISSLGFFLFSYHVHEKTILFPALAIYLVLEEHSFVVLWFSISSTLSLQPLLVKDGLLMPGLALLVLSLTFTFAINGRASLTKCHNFVEKAISSSFIISTMGYLFLLIASQAVRPPRKYPDVYAVAFAVWSCFHFMVFFAFFYRCQFFGQAEPAKKIV